MVLQPPVSTLTDTLLPDTTLCLSPPIACTVAVCTSMPRSRPKMAHAAPAMSSSTATTASAIHSPRRDGGGAALRSMRSSFSSYAVVFIVDRDGGERSEEHTSELQSLMRISYAVFCLKKKKN